MDDKIKKVLRFLGLGYMLFFCLGIIPYFGLLIGFKGEKLATVMLFPMVAWWIFFFIFLFSRDLGYESKNIKRESALKIAYIIAIIFSNLNLLFQICIIIFSKEITVIPMILSVLTKNPVAVIFAIFALFFGAMIFAPLFIHQFANADTNYYVKHTTTTYHDFGYSETKTSGRFIRTGQFVRMALLSSFLSFLLAVTPAVIIPLIIYIIKLNKLNKEIKNKK